MHVSGGLGSGRKDQEKLGRGERDGGREYWEKLELGGDIETQCTENSLESMRVTLVKSPINVGYRVQTGHSL